jgi:DNA-binding CsgD family transcriptional regulator
MSTLAQISLIDRLTVQFVVMNFMGDYSGFQNFIENYLPQGFDHISRLDPFIIDMEEKLRSGNQFFYVADLLKVRLLFTSWGSTRMLGVAPEQVDPFTFFQLAHPEDQERLNRAQMKLYKNGQELFNKKERIFIVSIQIRERRMDGNYFNLLLQTYTFFSEQHHTVFTLLIATELTEFISEGESFYYYAGADAAMFRYPDEALFNEGYNFSNRELEILKLIAAGLGSEQIADKLFLSVNTVNTHRRNILQKTNKSNTHELVIELLDKGIL